MKLICLFILLWLLALTIIPTATSGPCGPTEMGVAGNKLKQVMSMILKHRIDSRQTWPNPWSVAKQEFPKPQNNHDAMLVTAAMFEYLARTNRLSSELFQDSDRDWPHNGYKYRSIQEIIRKPDPRWAQFIALDWSADKKAGTLRPCLSTRRPINGVYLIVYADAHSAEIPPTPALEKPNATQLQTWVPDATGPRWSAITGTGDDIFSYNLSNPKDLNGFSGYATGDTDVWMK